MSKIINVDFTTGKAVQGEPKVKSVLDVYHASPRFLARQKKREELNRKLIAQQQEMAAIAR